MCNSAEEMKRLFVKNGWVPDIEFVEATEDAVYGCTTAIEQIRKGKKLFICTVSGNLYDARGNLFVFGKLCGYKNKT